MKISEFKIGDRIIYTGNAPFVSKSNLDTVRGTIVKVGTNGKNYVVELYDVLEKNSGKVGEKARVWFDRKNLELDKQYYREKRLKKLLDK